MILELLTLSSIVLADPVITGVSDPKPATLMSRTLTLVPQCELVTLDEGYREPVMVKKVCCSQAGKNAIAPALAKSVGGLVLRVQPLDSRTGEIYERGCTSDLTSTQFELKLNVTYLP